MEAKGRGGEEKLDENSLERDDLRLTERIARTQKVAGILSSERNGRWQNGQWYH